MVNLTVYNIRGEKVATLINEVQASGNYSVGFDGAGLSSGVYFYQLTMDHKIITKKMTLTK